MKWFLLAGAAVYFGLGWAVHKLCVRRERRKHSHWFGSDR